MQTLLHIYIFLYPLANYYNLESCYIMFSWDFWNSTKMIKWWQSENLLIEKKKTYYLNYSFQASSQYLVESVLAVISSFHSSWVSPAMHIRILWFSSFLRCRCAQAYSSWIRSICDDLSFSYSRDFQRDLTLSSGWVTQRLFIFIVWGHWSVDSVVWWGSPVRDTKCFLMQCFFFLALSFREMSSLRDQWWHSPRHSLPPALCVRMLSSLDR